MEYICEPLLGKSLYELKDVAARLGLPKFAAGQMAQCISGRHAI